MTSIISRAESVISTSASTSETGQKRKFFCAELGCGKAFSRSEHLHRHALNHKDGNNTCSRCAAHFRRRDLLDRHMQRHKEKDDEAGGDGLGILATRKRLWKDVNGNIVNARRPYKDSAKRVKSQMDETGNPSQDKAEGGRDVAPPSPPTSIPSIGSGQSNNEQPVNNDIVQDPWPQMDLNFIPNTDGNDLDFLSNSSWGNQPFQTLMGTPFDLPYDDIFKPDTAMSFNAPFTTMNYYSWLFENENSNSADALLRMESSPGSLSNNALSELSNTGFDANTEMQSFSSGSLDPNLLAQSPVSQRSQEGQLSNNIQSEIQSNQMKIYESNVISPILKQSPEDATGFDKHGSMQPPMAAQTAGSDTMLQYAFSSPNTNSGSSPTGFDSPSLYSSYQQHYATTQTSQISTPPTQRSGSLSSFPLPLPDSYTRRYPGKLPIISNEARDGLMQLVNQSRPTKPDGSEISSSDPLLSLSSLQHYSDLFFTRFNSSYPLIHQATFKSSNVPSLLLMSVILLGATYSDKEAHLLAVCIHDIMRPIIHGSKEFSTRPKLWMLQTILLVECFGKSRAGEKQHDMSHLYHGLLINLIRRSDCQSACIQAWDEKTWRLDEYWHAAIEAEQKRRLAMLCFMWDTQHAVLFSQSLCMNASELKITLPWDAAIWEADTAEEWLQASRASPTPPQYLTILKMYTTPNASSPPAHLNALSRVLILHGLMSVAWDLKRREQTSLNLAVTSSTGPWQSRISSCYDKWKLDFDSYTNSVLSSLSFSSAQHSKFQRFTVANLAVYHTAQLILEVDIIDLQIHAGAKHIIGRPVTEIDRQRSRNAIGEWIIRDEGQSAGRAAWHAARLFRDGVRKLENWNVDEMFHYPWCLYLATLMCWTLHNAAIESLMEGQDNHRPKPNEGSVLHHDEDDDEDSDWDSKVEMNALISALTRLNPANESFVKDMWKVAGKYRTGGLVKCMVKQLNTVRWAVVREGMIVLRNSGDN